MCSKQWLAHQTPQNGTMTTSGLLKWGNLVKCREQVRRPVCDKLVVDIDLDTDTAAESDPSQKSRSFLNRVNDRLRKMLSRSPEDSMQDIDKRSMIWWVFSVFDSGSICIYGKELLRQFAFHQKYRGKSHFRTDVRDIWKVDSWTIRWFLECLKSVGKVLHGNSYLWLIMKKSSVSRMQRFMYS